VYKIIGCKEKRIIGAQRGKDEADKIGDFDDYFAYIQGNERAKITAQIRQKNLFDSNENPLKLKGISELHLFGKY
jgi:hypothetical protein